MALEHVAAALERARTVLERRPDLGLHDDAPALARWEGGTRVRASHANGTSLATDMPAELGGAGEGVTPGWLFRAGVASCAATSIAMAAAAQGIELDTLAVKASSRSDTRGVLGLADAGGARVFPGPGDFRLHVRIGARGVPAERLRRLVEEGHRRSPIPAAVACAVPVALSIDVEAA